MKRKSILLTIVAILFASATWGQGGWPDAATAAAKAKECDTIYFCLSTDSLYPIELGYDVAGKRLHPSFGDWSLIATTSSSVTAVDYAFDATIKNGGAGNAYKTVGSGVGGLLFQYESKDIQCGLNVGEKYWVYVFVLPVASNGVKTDTFYCWKKGETPLTVDFDKIYKDTIDLYKRAGLNVTAPDGGWKHGSTSFAPIKLDSVATYYFRDTLVVATKTESKSYSCGTLIPFEYEVRVDSIARDTLGKGYVICTTDTVDENGKRSPNYWFKRNLKDGKYREGLLPSSNILNSIVPWKPADKANKYKIYYYHYGKCYGAGIPKPIQDTLYIIDVLPSANVGGDTVMYCRGTSSVSLLDEKIWGKASYPGLKPDLNAGNSYWLDFGIKRNAVVPTAGKSPDYGTLNERTSLKDGNKLKLDSMRASIIYHYKWSASGIDCFYDAAGDPGWGILSLILQDPVSAQDYTAQVCLSLDKLNLNTYTYEVPADCGTGGKGVFYLKVAPAVKIPRSKTVVFCAAKLPAAINLNDVLGIAAKNLTWSAIDNSNPWFGNAAFSTADGTLDITKFVQASGGNIPSGKVTFTTVAGTDSCVPGGINLTIDFTGTF
jgi:hypothetical protein